MNNTAITSGRLTVGKTYLFQNKADGSRSLNVWCSSTYPATNLSNVCLWETDTDDTAQQWILARADNNTNYVLKSVENSAKCLDLYTGTGDGANINAHLYSQSSTSYLIFENGAYSNTVRIRLAGTTKNGYYLTANQGSHGTRTGKGVNSSGNVYFYSTLLTDNSQEWEIIEIGSSSGGSTSGDYCWPTEGTAFSRGFSSTHDGVDIKGSTPGVAGDEVYAYTDGYVSYVGTPESNPNEGYTVRIHHNNPLQSENGYARIRTQYMHLNSAPLVSKFEDVSAGDLIGYMGSTGNSTGVHLHFEVRGGSESEFPLGGTSSNGFYTGTVLDPTPYLELTGTDF